MLSLSGLDIHCTEWDGGGRTTVVLLHGFLDVGRSWSFMVEALGDVDWHIVAPDLRGHGCSEWIGRGGYYHFADYVRDLEQLIASVRRDRVVVVGHSMGAGIGMLWAGVRPERFDGLVLVDGIGPVAIEPAHYVARFQRWLDQTAPFPTATSVGPMTDLAAAADRLGRTHTQLSQEQLGRLAGWTARAGVDGRVSWRFDPLHRTRSPAPIPAGVYLEVAGRVRCPVLWVGGERSPWSTPSSTSWLESIGHVERVLLKGAGHMVHTDRPEELAARLRGFIEKPVG